ncbi:MAG: hypothetical protein EZS28_033264 [Streblomastix strix]|uniref:Uncharacterized protein n=1 Tax=Streblomastix strix TaxID=222440 RepID=A0A5J4UMI2_9EUKA|nr:MAG: hypothetical protein EZS28_033264 [Streblomastix strix]
MLLFIIILALTQEQKSQLKGAKNPSDPCIIETTGRQIQVGSCTCAPNNHSPAGCICSGRGEQDCYCNNQKPQVNRHDCRCLGQGGDPPNCLCSGQEGEPSTCVCRTRNDGTVTPGSCTCSFELAHRPKYCLCRDKNDKKCYCNNRNDNPEGCLKFDNWQEQLNSSYGQVHNSIPHRHHWMGTPEGSDYDGSCWLCNRGCFVLTILRMKNLQPTEENVKRFLNNKADVDWSKADITKSEEIQKNSIGKVRKELRSSGRSHYVQVLNVYPSGYVKVYDPDGDKIRVMKKQDFEYFHMMNSEQKKNNEL